MSVRHTTATGCRRPNVTDWDVSRRRTSRTPAIRLSWVWSPTGLCGYWTHV